MTRSTTGILVFVLTCFGLSTLLGLAVGLTGGQKSPLIGLGYLSMLLPTVAAIVVSVAMKEPVRVRWDRFEVRYLPIALLLIPGVLHAVMLPLSMATEPGVHWQDWLTPQSDGLYHTAASRGWGTLTLQGLAAHIVLNAVVGLAIVSLFALFEEVGWRAWLLPQLSQWLSPRPAVVVTSILWALWHLPFQLSGIQHINGVSPFHLALIMPLGIVAVGLILGWLWLRTESLWLVAIAHGASNNWGQYAFKYMTDSGTPNKDIAVLETGFAALLLVGAFFLWRACDVVHDS